MDTSFISEFKGKHLLVAGEVGIDEYIWGDTLRISPEAPVPVIEVDSQTQKLGMAANVAQNIERLGGQTTLISVCGSDSDGQRVQTMLEDANLKRHTLIQDPHRPTLRKVRVIARKQHVVRVDYEKRDEITAPISEQFRTAIEKELPHCDGVIVQDYGKGLWTQETITFVEKAKNLKKPIYVDPCRQAPLALYRGTTLLTPNLHEAESLCRRMHEPTKSAGTNDQRLHEMATQILTTTEAEHAIITCGPWGMVSVSKEEKTKKLKRIPTFAREVFDVTGAGDTVVAVLALMHLVGYPLSRCMQIANAAAGIVVGRVGGSSVTPTELEAEIARLEKVGLLESPTTTLGDRLTVGQRTLTPPV